MTRSDKAGLASGAWSHLTAGLLSSMTGLTRSRIAPSGASIDETEQEMLRPGSNVAWRIAEAMKPITIETCSVCSRLVCVQFYGLVFGPCPQLPESPIPSQAFHRHSQPWSARTGVTRKSRTRTPRQVHQNGEDLSFRTQPRSLHAWQVPCGNPDISGYIPCRRTEPALHCCSP